MKRPSKDKARSSWFSTFRNAHRWIGLILTLPILLVTVSGGLLLLKEPYYQARFPRLSEHVQEHSMVAYARLLERLESQFDDDGIRLIKFPQEGMNVFQVWLADDSQAFIDPDTGEALSRWHWYESLPSFLFGLHAHLLTGATGTTVNGLIGILLLLLLLTAPWLWWPRRSLYELKKALPRSLSVRSLLGSHETIGILALPLIVFFVASGSAMVFFPTVSDALSSLLDAEAPSRPTASVEFRDEPQKSWPQILAKLQSTLPEGPTVFYYPGSSDNAVLTFRKRMPGEWHPNGRSYVLIDPYTGEVLQSIDARLQGLGTRLSNVIYPLHAALWGGGWVPSFALLASISLAGLAISGALSYTIRVRCRAQERNCKILYTGQP